MIKVRGHRDDGTPFFVFGITKMNVERMKAGDPIRIDNGIVKEKGTTIIAYGTRPFGVELPANIALPIDVLCLTDKELDLLKTDGSLKLAGETIGLPGDVIVAYGEDKYDLVGWLRREFPNTSEEMCKAMMEAVVRSPQ